MFGKYWLFWSSQTLQDLELTGELGVWSASIIDDGEIDISMDFPKNLTFHVLKDTKNNYLKHFKTFAMSLELKQDNKVVSWSIQENQITKSGAPGLIPPASIDPSINNLPLIIGISAGVGVLVLAGDVVWTVIGIKKYKKSNKFSSSKKHKKH